MDLYEEKPSSITPAGLLAVAYRRRWLMLVSFLFGWGLLAGAAWMLPSRYRSETLIMVEQQKVPEHYVVSNVASDLQNRLQSMSEEQHKQAAQDTYEEAIAATTSGAFGASAESDHNSAAEEWHQPSFHVEV